MPDGIVWSADVARAEWIRRRLGPFDAGVATSVVPAGFPAYARVLHPAHDFAEERPVRWREVAARNGLALGPGTGFAEIALLPPSEQGPAFPELRGPEEGTLPAADARALAEVLRRRTSVAEDCWFGLWDGYGWVDEVLPDFLAAAQHPPHEADPAPYFPVRPGAAVPGVAPGWSPAPIGERPRGPRVELPNREYVLYRGGLEAALAFVASRRQTPNLWWPGDRAWCVATEIYGWWTYVGGSEELVGEIVTDDRLEAWHVDPGDSEEIRLPAWVEPVIDDAVQRVMAGEHGVVATSLGTVTATMRRPEPGGQGDLWLAITGPDGSPEGSGWSSLSDRDDETLRSTVRTHLAWALLDDVLM